MALLTPSAGHGRELAAVPKPDLSLSAMFSYFSGSWFGRGEFAGGKKIEADVSFAIDLDNQCLLYRHTDRLPNKYHSVGMWGIERNAKKLSMIITDSFNGIRLFTAEAWDGDQLIFTNSSTISEIPANTDRKERFIFKRIDNSSFKMTYESNTNNAGWKLGDYLIFQKQA